MRILKILFPYRGYDDKMRLVSEISVFINDNIIIERRIGEQFKYEGVTLEVAEDPHNNHCGDCYFRLKIIKCFLSIDKTGECYAGYREDKREVYFKEVKK